MNIWKTENEFGTGMVYNWASIIDDNTREQAKKISRLPIVEGHVALMPDAHFGYGPPVGTAMLTRGAVMPYAVGVDIGCGMIAMKINDLFGADFDEQAMRSILGRIRKIIPSGVGTKHEGAITQSLSFFEVNSYPLGIFSTKIGNKRGLFFTQTKSLAAKALDQFGTLGAGNHFVEVSEGDDNMIWLVLHSGSRGIGNMLATAHAVRAKVYCEERGIKLEDKDFAWVEAGSEEFDDYIKDMLWAQKYALASREAMMDSLIEAVRDVLPFSNGQMCARINCHHNYAEEIEPGLWLTRKGAINAEVDRPGVIPGSMGALTYIVKGKGCAEALNTSPHGAGRIKSRGAARRELDVEDFKKQMAGKTWQDRDAQKLLDEAPEAYKPIQHVIKDSEELVRPIAILSQFINYKGI